jgi:hypothetical protein
MALPIIANSVPKYDMVIPSSKKKIRFRPFLVKEQKTLLIAYESKDKTAMIRAMIDTIESCVTDEIDVYKLSTFDIDYLFAQIRAKSVGENTQLLFNCESCDTQNEVSVDISKARVDIPTNVESVVKITDTISVKMKYPDYNYFIKNIQMFDESKSQMDSLTDIVVSCIDSVLTEDEVIRIADEPREEVITFIESLTSAQFDKINKFIESLPKIKQEVKFTCAKCQHENVRKLEGLEDFF